MRTYWGLIPKYLYKQKKQSILIGISIILSVMLISIIGNIGETIHNTLIEQVKTITGDYHASYNYVNKKQVDLLKNDSRVSKIGTSLLLGNGVLKNSNVQMTVSGYDAKMLEMKRVQLLDGTYAVNSGEIVIEEWLAKELGNDGKIGSQIDIDFKGEEYEYQGTLIFKIVGIINDNASSKTLGLSMAYVAQEEVSKLIPDVQNSYRAIVEVSKQMPVLETIDDLKQVLMIKDEQYSPNDPLLEEMQNSWSSNYIILILGACIVIAAIMMIYNVFYIMVTENINEFGKLRTIGASPRQVRRIILGQGVVIGIVSIPIGILIGVLVTKGLSSIIKELFEFNIEKMVISETGIILSSFIGVVTTIVGALSPARLAGKISPIEALNTNGEIVKLKKQKHLIAKIFGKNGEIAYRNLLRDRKKTAVTILSISMGIVLVIIFSFYSSSLKTNYITGGDSIGNYKILSQNDFDYDIGIDEKVKKKLVGIDGVEKIYGVSYTTSDWTIYTDETINENLKAVFGVFKDEQTNQYCVASNLYGYDEEALRLCEKYLVEGTVDWQKLISGKGVLVAENITCFGGKVETQIHIGDKIALKKFAKVNDEIKWEDPQYVEVMGILSDLPLKQSESVMGLTIITPQTIYNELTQYKTLQRIELEVRDDVDEEVMRNSLESIAGNQFTSVLSMQEVIRQREQEQRNITLLGNALIAVIIFIGYMNMTNTIKTSLLKRKREFGMLKAIGIAHNTITKIVSLEGVIYGMLSGILGAIIGNVGSYIFFVLEEKNMSLTWQLPWQMTICAWIGAIIVGYISSRRSMHSIADMNIIESIE